MTKLTGSGKVKGKLVAGLLLSSVLVACESENIRNDEPFVSGKIYHLRPTAASMEWDRGEQYAVYEENGIYWRVRYIESGAAGLTFWMMMENASDETFILSNEQIACTQVNRLGSAKKRFAALSEGQILDPYDKQIQAVPSVDPDPLQLVIDLLKLVFFFASIATDQPVADYDDDYDLNNTPQKVAAREEYDRRVESLSAQKEQHRDKLIKAQTLKPGNSIDGEIDCPFDALGDAGLSIEFAEQSQNISLAFETY